MKRISKIELENSRAYYNRQTFSLEKGENLLLYGENGSGKTSLYKSLRDFIQSFYAPVAFTPNRYKEEGELGEVVLSIGDYDEATQSMGNVVAYRLASGVDNTQVADTAFMKSLALTRGFLNYRDLLKVYLYDEKNPNLFKFFVEQLLANYIPVGQGRRVEIKEEWDSINKLLFKVHDRRTKNHRRGLLQLAEFEDMLRSVLDILFEEVNRYLAQYFDTFQLSIGYDLKPMTFLYHRRKREWEIVRDLRLKIELCNSPVDDYTEGLNEARLSAVAICLYLAMLHFHPGQDLRLMFLDDIFIGIDSANRWPIMEILDKEFRDFQIIIATYDRSWYCMAQNYLLTHSADRWRFVNLFSFPQEINGRTLNLPVKVSGTSSFERAKEYLHGGRKVDLPAAANYFRKTLEELLNEKKLPKELFMSDDYTVIPGFKLTQRAEAVGKLFSRIEFDTSHIYIVQSYLHPLIHPLSHYEEEAQVYRTELVAVEKAIVGLKQQIKTFSQKCRLFLGKGNDLCIRYDTADGRFKSNYFIQLQDNLWLYKDAAGNAKFADCKCRIKYMDGEENGQHLRPFIPSKKTHFTYVSLDDALRQIYEHEVNDIHHAVEACTDYDKVFFVKDMQVKTCIQARRDEVVAEM